MSHSTLETFRQDAERTITHLRQEFSRLQTGRANAALVEHIHVDAYGQRMEMKSVASISVQDARSLAIQPWDNSLLAIIEKALQQADIGCNPVNDGRTIRLNFPPMTEERRLHLKKSVGQLAEQAKIKVRQSRHDVNIRLQSETAEDIKERAQKDLQKLVDDANEQIDNLSKQKETDIMTV